MISIIKQLLNSVADVLAPLDEYRRGYRAGLAAGHAKAPAFLVGYRKGYAVGNTVLGGKGKAS